MVVLLVMSGKGGVGKSSVAVLLAQYLSENARNVGLLDLDTTGPSLGCLLGVRDAAVTTDEQGLLVPHRVSETLECLSIAFLLMDADRAVAWRGPRKGALVKRMLESMAGRPHDILVVDTPPGILEEHLVIAETLHGKALSLIVTTPHVCSSKTGPCSG